MSGNVDDAGRHDAPDGTRRLRLGRHRPDDRNGHEVLTRLVDGTATLVTVVAMIICVILALHIAFVAFSANDGNVIVKTIGDWADRFAGKFRDMFLPKDRRVEVLVNYGIAAVVYLIAGRVAAGLIRRLR